MEKAGTQSAPALRRLPFARQEQHVIRKPKCKILRRKIRKLKLESLDQVVVSILDADHGCIVILDLDLPDLKFFGLDLLIHLIGKDVLQ